MQIHDTPWLAGALLIIAVISVAVTCFAAIGSWRVNLRTGRLIALLIANTERFTFLHKATESMEDHPTCTK